MAYYKSYSLLLFLLFKVCFTFVLDLEGFDSVVSSTEKLSHPTTSRPKATGRRPPSQSLTSVSTSLPNWREVERVSLMIYFGKIQLEADCQGKESRDLVAGAIPVGALLPAGGARVMVWCHYHQTIGLWWRLVLANFLIGPFQTSVCNRFFLILKKNRGNEKGSGSFHSTNAPFHTGLSAQLLLTKSETMSGSSQVHSQVQCLT